MEATSFIKSENEIDEDNPARDYDGDSSITAHNEDPKKNKRRTRNDADSRNFVCGCGKAYLSYAALYTHIKTKHDGIAPSGTPQLTTNTDGKSGRGRPKKDKDTIKTKEIDKTNEDALSGTKNIQEFLEYLSKLGTTIRYDNQNLQDNDNSIISSSSLSPPGAQTYNPIESFPIDIFPSRCENEYMAIVDNLKLIKDANMKNLITDEIDPNSELYKTKMNKIFAIFLCQIIPHIRPEFYRELCFFVCMFRKCLNQIGWKTKQLITSNNPNIDQRELNIEYCEVNNGEYAPDICNDFIVDSLPEYFEMNAYKLKNFKVFGPTIEQLKNAVFITQYFCNWLNSNKFTNSTLSINMDENQT